MVYGKFFGREFPVHRLAERDGERKRGMKKFAKNSESEKNPNPAIGGCHCVLLLCIIANARYSATTRLPRRSDVIDANK